MARKPDEWMPLHIGDYHADTTHLTREQHGAYLLLLMAYWRRGGPLPADDGRLAAIAKATAPEWRKLRPVMAEFFSEENGEWVQKRADLELSKAKRLTEAKAEAGRKGAKNRWQTDGELDGTAMAQPSNSHRQADAPIPSPSPIPRQKDLNSFVVGGGLGNGRRRVEMTPQNKLALFQKWLADTMGKDGWQIVGKAADPECPEYSEALEFCKKFARERGKGWPHQWPAPGAAA